jgi:hypothetical protein
MEKHVYEKFMYLSQKRANGGLILGEGRIYREMGGGGGGGKCLRSISGGSWMAAWFER